MASRKLRPYFQAHQIEVRTSYPLKQVMHRPKTSGRMLKWTIELSQFDIEYKPRNVMKGQALADFILEFTLQFEGDDKALISPHALDEIKQIKENDAPWWTLYIDGAANSEGAGVGVVLMSPEGHKLSSAIHFSYKATNNDTEYEALINGLQLALKMKGG